MNKDAQRIAIAEARGWTDCHTGPGWEFDVTGTPTDWSGSRYHRVPDYLKDLNAMHEVLMGYFNPRPAGEAFKYLNTLAFVLNVNPDYISMALVEPTAAQKAEAFLKYLNLWTPSP